ncbi:MAG: hypothetical protein D3920_15620 [Candidatus Electrothrix sp. AW2]|nr:hypothetical protein [Candidatus Electrothrix gigas]
MFVNVILLGFFLLLQTTTGCGAAHEPANMVEFRRIVSSDSIEEGKDYLDNLPLESRIEIAQFAVNDADQNISILGIQVLVESGLLDEAVPALSERVLEGDDLTAFGYSWTHSDDPQLAVRMYLKISRYMLARFESFNTEQKKKTEWFIVSNLGRDNSLKEFSVEKAEQRLSQIETHFIQAEQ